MLSTKNELRLDSQTITGQSFPSLITKLYQRTQPKISQLLNCHIWYLKAVYILYEKNGYLLIVQKKDNITYAKKHKTLKDARKDFLTLFPLEEFVLNLKEKGIDIKPQWTVKYSIDRDWLEQKYNQLSKYFSKEIKPLKPPKERTGNPSSLKPQSTYPVSSPTQKSNKENPIPSFNTKSPCSHASMNSSKAPRSTMSSPYIHVPMQPCLIKTLQKSKPK